VDTAPALLSDRGRLAGLVQEVPADPAARHAQLFQAVIRAREGGRAWAAERFWQQVITLVPGAGGQLCGAEARSAHGRDRFSLVKPQCWAAASFEHHCGSRDDPGHTATTSFL
jgi:hypothetical protein